MSASKMGTQKKNREPLMPKIQTVLANNARRLRVLMRKTQKEISVMAGISQKTISNLETPDSPVSPKLATIEAVASGFKLHPAMLLLDGITDDALTDRQVGLMIEQFARLPEHRKKQVMELIADFTRLEN